MLPRPSRLLVALAALLVLSLFALPLWRIDLVAPQYPEGLGMLIRIDGIDGVNPNDLQNINLLNHYIGMKAIHPESIPELRIMPWIVGLLAACGLAVAVTGRRRLLQAWIAGFLLLGAVGLADFWRWGYDYGHDLDQETAVIKVPGMSYQPPLIGSKELLNFTAVSLPASGGVLLGGALVLGIAATLVGRAGTTSGTRGSADGSASDSARSETRPAARRSAPIPSAGR